MLSDQNLRDEVLHLLAITNNFIMELEVKGDNTLKAADIMQRCHLIFNYMNPSIKEEVHGSEEINGEDAPGDGDAA